MTGKRVVLHIGTMKSGTTFLQSVLTTHRSLLADLGVHAIAGGGSSEPGAGRPHGAAKSLQQGTDGPQWREIVDAIEGSACPTVVVSSEFFSFLRPGAVQTALTALADHDVTVVLSVRDQLTAIPAQWQSFTRNGGTSSFPAYARQITDTDRVRLMAYRTFHRAQDVPAIVGRWARPEVDRLVLVTVPPSGSPPDLMWRRFSEAAGIPPAEVTLDAVKDNQSLGYAACDYLRRLNRRLGELDQVTYRQLVRSVAADVLAPLRDAQGRPELDRSTALWARDRNRQVRDLIESGRVAHVGDPTDLPVDVDADRLPEEIPPPALAQVRESAAAVHRYVAERVGDTTPAPAVLPRVIAATVRLVQDPAFQRQG